MDQDVVVKSGCIPRGNATRQRNAQTADMLFWIHAMAENGRALHYVPSLTASFGSIMASGLRRLAGANAGPINLFPRVEFWAYSSVMPTTNPSKGPSSRLQGAVIRFTQAAGVFA
jgi:hypothetical protein